MKNKKSYISLIVSILLVLLTVFLCIFTFNTINKVFFKASVNQTMETTEVIRDLGIHLVEDNLRILENNLEKTAINYSEKNVNSSSDKQVSELSKLSLPQYGINYWLATSDGKAIDSDGKEHNWKTELDLKPIFKNGKTHIIDPYFNKEEKYILSIATPLRENNQITGVLIIHLDGFCISKWLEDIQFNTGEGVSYIVNSKGRNIAASRKENYDWITSQYNAQELANSNEESKTVANLEKLALDGKSGRGSYIWQGSRNYLVYAPMKKTNWGFYVGFYGAKMNAYIKKSAKTSIMSSVPFFITTLAFFILLILYVNYNLRKERKYVHELLIQKQEIQQQAEDLSINEERFRVAMAQTNNIIFEYDLLTGGITNYYAKQLNPISISLKDVKDQIISDGTIDDESIIQLQEMFDDINNGLSNNECIIKVIYPNENYAWYKVSVSSQSNYHTRVIGIMENITKEKLGELDSLTGLLNKKVFTEKTLSYLNKTANDSYYALLIFDIDNFKNINDSLGHPMGDHVIIQTGYKLKNTFTHNAFIGRIGGDEFCVFWYDFISIQELKDLLDIFYSQSILAGEKISVTYSCGVVLSNGMKITYEKLYKNADTALYKAKNQGKNQYYIYSEKLDK
ncbi:diguanylate cyclase [Clostridioides difficile]|nr:diguanylate cyclase [Clostridioides difficile]